MHPDHARRSAGAPARVVAGGLLALILLPTPFSGARASDDYLPFVEPLQVTQKRAYYSAAPTGRDEPLATPATPLNITVAMPAEAESRIESEARQKQQALTLADSAQAQTFDDELEQFGYDIFNRAPSTFAPVEGIPVPADYRIGPGDNIVIQLFGKRNVEYSLVVTRDGKVLIPEFGPLAVGGLSFDDAEKLITSGFEQRMIGARAVVTMGKLRTIQVRLTGDVRQPGIYTIGGLSSLVDALLTTGGVAGTGTLRDIQLIRDGKRVTRLDLYSLLLAGRSDGDTFLRHNDTIFVPALGDIVYVGGEVQRPAIYELRGETTLGEVLGMAGGLLPTASLADSLIERIRPGGSRTVVDFRAASGTTADDAQIRATPVRSGDVLRILPLENELDAVVLLEGQVERPGAYQFSEGMRLSALLSSRDALRAGADLRFALIKREDRQSLRSTVRYVVPQAALEAPGSDADPYLQARDRVRVFSLAEDRATALDALRATLESQASDSRAAAVIELQGALRHTGRLPLDENARLLDALALGGGLRTGGDAHYGIIARTSLPGLHLEIIDFSLAAAERDPLSDANPRLQRGDRIYFFADDSDRSALLGEELRRLREQARFGATERVVSILGEVLSPGDYPLTQGLRASDLLCAARGLSRRADGLQLELSSRTPGNDDRIAHRALDSGALMALCADSRRADRGELDPAAAADFAAAYSDAQRNPLLQPRDQLAVSMRSGWSESATVTLAGEVHSPGVYAIAAGETLCSVLERAGGLTPQAYSYGAEFTRLSVRDIQQETLDALQNQLDDLMIELSLSHSYNNEEKASHEWAGKQDTLRVIRQLERAQPSGRLVIDLEREQRCRRDALVLENGDQLFVPREPNYVQVAGQVYVTTSHLYDERRSVRDYVELSGGHTVLGRIDHTYVIQANGEVLNLKGSRRSSRASRRTVMPGARIYVPINVDRMNPTEKAQSWVSTLAQSAILAGIVL